MSVNLMIQYKSYANAVVRDPCAFPFSERNASIRYLISLLMFFGFVCARERG